MKSWGFSRMRKQWIPGHFSLRLCGLGTRLELQYAMVGWNKVATVFKLLLGVNKLMCVIIVQSL